MIQAIKELGEIKLEKEKKDIISILTENPNSNGNYPKTLAIVFEKKDNEIKYDRIIIEDTKEKEYLYRRRASKGPNFTPTTKITEINKTFREKIDGWFKKLKSDSKFLNKLKESFENYKKEILDDLIKKWENLKSSLQRNQGAILTLAFREQDSPGLKYLFDYPEFKEFLKQSVIEKYGEISKENHICSVCNEKKEIVFGNAIPFKFYTLDKPGYIAGGFNKKLGWKNAPVCLECSLKIEEGKRFLEETKSLSLKMGGEPYYLIPKFLLGKEKKDIIDAFFEKASRPEETLDVKSLRRITEDENEILEELGKLKDVLTYNFLFYRKSNQEFKINLFVEDVLPSRISKIFSAKKSAESVNIFKNIRISKNKYQNIEFRFDILKSFTPSRREFLEIIDKVFRGIELNPDLLFSWFISKISENFKKEKYIKTMVLESFVSLLFFIKLGIVSFKQIKSNIGGKIMNELRENIEKKFFEKFPETFYTPAHKAVFLLGVLTQKLLNIQFNERGSTPFMKYLKGLRMKEEDLKSLLPKIQNKLEEYNKNYYRSLESLISIYFIEAGKNWKISTDELNYYFVLGMNLKDKIDEILNLKKED